MATAPSSTAKTLTLTATITVPGPEPWTREPHQWLRCGSVGENCSPSTGATTGSSTSSRQRRFDAAGPRHPRQHRRTRAGTSPESAARRRGRPTSLEYDHGGDDCTQGVTVTATTGTWTGTTRTRTHGRCDENGSNCDAVDRHELDARPYRRRRRQEAQGRRDCANGFRPPATATSNATEVVSSNTPTNTVRPAITTTAADHHRRHVAHGDAGGRGSGADDHPHEPVAALQSGRRRLRQHPRCNLALLHRSRGRHRQEAASRVTATNSAGTTKAVSDRDADDRGLAAGHGRGRPSAGTATTGQSLSATVGRGPHDADHLLVQWRRCNASGTCATIAGATSASYVVATVDVGSTLTVAVTARNASGSATVQSSTTGWSPPGTGAPAGPRPAPANTEAPTFRGTLARGKVLTGRERDVDREHADDVLLPVAAVPGATTACTPSPARRAAPTRLVAADVGKRIRLRSPPATPPAHDRDLEHLEGRHREGAGAGDRPSTATPRRTA